MKLKKPENFAIVLLIMFFLGIFLISFPNVSAADHDCYDTPPINAYCDTYNNWCVFLDEDKDCHRDTGG